MAAKWMNNKQGATRWKDVDYGKGNGMVKHPRYATSNTRTKHIEKSNPHTVSVSQNQCLINGGKLGDTLNLAGHYTCLLKNNGSERRKRPSQETFIVEGRAVTKTGILAGVHRAIQGMERKDMMIYPHGRRNALRTPVLMI